MSRKPHFFNCSKCPAHCCSYDHIEAKPADVERLAKHHGLPVEVASKRFTKLVPGGSLRVLRHQKDAIFGSVCQFLNLETRQCGIYDARPRICREHPGSVRCGFYDFLCSERELQDDPDYVPSFTRG
ncbi:MAG: YkgJ family cysteine cluster protein [Thermoanaerobaculia bacterium]|jgi:Fe-S-cluster containining protein|nr:YkgJ family cysteine cluster protein [Thermoanaerobaculia bacterium]MBP9823639.1 YkgJ family cysteine cluster protein [Thermoanaerobaculia bacterium]